MIFYDSQDFVIRIEDIIALHCFREDDGKFSITYALKNGMLVNIDYSSIEKRDTVFQDCLYLITSEDKKIRDFDDFMRRKTMENIDKKNKGYE